MFNSIQGLQQRLHNYSLEEIAKASDTSRTLILRLTELHLRVARIVEIEQFAIAASIAIERATAEILDSRELESPDATPRLRETIPVGKIIKFPRTPRVSWNEVQMLPKPAHGRDIPKENSTSQTIDAQSPFTQPTALDTDQPDWSVSANPSALDAEQELQPETNTPNPADEILAYSAAESTQIPPAPPMDATEQLSAPAETNAGSECESTETFEPPFTETQTHLPSGVDEELTDETRTADAADAKALVPMGADFDQRLLHDLIKDYGEFASSPYVPAPIKPNNDSPAANDNNGHKASATSAEEPQFADRHLPRIQKEGEIDRKLKKLIKDYGEYDLYSRQSPVNLKTGVVGAFLLLGVIFSGFYFLSSPKDVASSRPFSTTAPGTTSRQIDADVRNNRPRAAEKPAKTASGGTVELPQAAEAGEFNPVPNQAPLTKKN